MDQTFALLAGLVLFIGGEIVVDVVKKIKEKREKRKEQREFELEVGRRMTMARSRPTVALDAEREITTNRDPPEQI
jgi:hypothetical protein